MAADYVPLLYGSTFGPAVTVTRILIALLVIETAFNQAMMILTVDERYATVLKLVAIQTLAAPLGPRRRKIFGRRDGGSRSRPRASDDVGRRLPGLSPPLRAAVSLGLHRQSTGRHRWAWARCSALGRALLPTSAVEAVSLTIAGAIVFAIGIRLTGAIGAEEIGLLRRANLPGGRWLLSLLGAPMEAR